MKWTSEKPTKPGWYWHKHNTQPPWRSFIVLVDQLEDNEGRPIGDGRLIDLETGDAVAEWDGQWAGPIEEPTE